MPSKHVGVGSEDANIEIAPAPAPSYLSVKGESINSGNARTFKVKEPLNGHDGGASGEFVVSLDRVPISMGGTEADNAQQAINNLLGLVKGAVLYCDGKNWFPLTGKEGQGIAIVNGLPAFTNSNVPIPSTASVVTIEDESKVIPNSVQLAAGDGITINKGSIAVDGTIVRTQAVKELQALLNAFRVEAVLLEGNQTIDGIKHFNDLRLDGEIIIANEKVYNLPDKADNIVGEEAIQTLTNKTLVDPIIESGCQITFKNVTGSYVLKTIAPVSGRVYSFYDANTDGDIAIKSGVANQGGIAYGDGHLIKFTEEGAEGEVLISHKDKPPTFGRISEAAGGTGQRAYDPGDILYADAKGKLQKMPIGKPGQTMKVGLNGLPGWE